MKILIHSKSGDSAGLAHRFKKEGHEVAVYIKNPGARDSMDNMVNKVSSMVEGVRMKPDFILFDREGDGDLADRLRKSGLNVLGGSALADKMELERQYGIDLMQKSGIKTPETNYFKSVAEAQAFVKKKPNAYAIKLDGNKGAATSYVAKDDKDMTEYLTYIQDCGMVDKSTRFVLQEVVKGVEISTEVWFAKGKPVLPYNGTLETKKFLPGDLGPNTGCETSAVFPYTSSAPKMVERTIKKIFPLMEKEGWSGPLDINCIVSEKDHEPYGLEWTVRLGYSAIYGLAAVIEEDIAGFFYGIASGKMSRIPLRHSWGTSLRLSIPPYPYENPEDEELEARIFDPTAGARVQAEESKHLWLLEDVKKDAKGRLVTAGIDGTIAECTGVGDTLGKAWMGSQKVFKSVSVPNKQGRLIDGSERAYRDASRLKGWGYDVPSPTGGVPSPQHTTPSR